MRRLCDSWTKSDDDKADTSRMDDDKEKVVEMNDKDEIKMLKTQVDSYGHQPRMGPRMSTRPHRYLEESRRNDVVFEEGQDALLGCTTTVYIHI